MNIKIPRVYSNKLKFMLIKGGKLGRIILKKHWWLNILKVEIHGMIALKGNEKIEVIKNQNQWKNIICLKQIHNKKNKKIIKISIIQVKFR